MVTTGDDPAQHFIPIDEGEFSETQVVPLQQGRPRSNPHATGADVEQGAPHQRVGEILTPEPGTGLGTGNVQEDRVPIGGGPEM